jgi:hypothetical protein
MFAGRSGLAAALIVVLTGPVLAQPSDGGVMPTSPTSGINPMDTPGHPGAFA